ncbi:hypothetical protein JNB85_01855 [Rhizobium mesosinicum]|uniref:TnsA endonuclease N-terminal domain-containing protein n=2 Tax=Rhizobium mesosinicum TaxID=335017 RepID=A0ABS7GME5_9HYPH|nr:hypothetical protein [Rhizobium mesosinicum]
MSILQSTARTRRSSHPSGDKTFRPAATVKCVGRQVFRSQVARDVGCLLDVDPEVTAWSCMATTLSLGDDFHVADFTVTTVHGYTLLLDAPDRRNEHLHETIAQAAHAGDRGYRVFDLASLREGYRLQNARDLLRYGNHQCPLGDRVRLLAALEEYGSMTVSESLNAFKETSPMAGLATLALHGYIEIELDEGPIGPETIVRRLRR